MDCKGLAGAWSCIGSSLEAKARACARGGTLGEGASRWGCVALPGELFGEPPSAELVSSSGVWGAHLMGRGGAFCPYLLIGGKHPAGTGTRVCVLVCH